MHAMDDAHRFRRRSVLRPLTRTRAIVFGAQAAGVVVLAVLFSRWLGVNGIWLSWPVGWFVGTVLSMVFYRTSIYRQAEEKTTL